MFNLLEAFDNWFEFINNFSASDVVDLVEITNASLNELNQDECLNDGIACAANFNTIHVALVESTQCIAEIFLDLTLGSYSNFIVVGLFFFLLDLLVSLHIQKCDILG